MQMASGAKFVSGSFTVPNDASTYTINFEKTFARYIFICEMSDTSKASLLNSGQNANKTYILMGIYPTPGISNYNPTNQCLFSRINPTSTDVAMSASGNFVSNIDESSITLAADAVSGSLYRVYRGYEYNYYIVEIK